MTEWLALWLARKALEKGRWKRWLALVPVAGFLMVVLLMAVIVGITSANQGNCSTSGQPISAPTGTLKQGELVKWFEQAGWSPNASAGIVGNMSQEDSTLDPAAAGGGLVQNLGNMLALQTAYDSQHGLDPNSAAGQLEFLAYWVPQQSWWSQFNNAPTPQDAALWFQNNYEQCSGAGARGTDQQGGGLCNPANRQAQAIAALQAAGGSQTPIYVSSSSGACQGTTVGPAGAQKIEQMAIAVEGTPYSTGGHATAFTMTATQLRASATDCSGFISWLMGPQGLGIWTQPLATPSIPNAPHLVSGVGTFVTLYNNPGAGQSGHVWVAISNRYWEEGGSQGNEHEMTQAEANYYLASGQFQPWHIVGL